MSKLDELNGLKRVVYDALIAHEQARDDDRILYLKILADFCEVKGKDISKISIREWLTYNSSYPNYDSISRARRKVQELYPETRGEDAAKYYRTELTKAYKKFARGKEK